MNSIPLHSKSHTLLPGRQLANKQKKKRRRFLLWHFSDDIRGDIVCVYLRLCDYKTDFKNRDDNLLLNKVICGTVNKLRIFFFF